jgi:antitoxin ParD1/3/4
VRDGLRLLQDQEELRRAKLDWLRVELQRGLEGGPSSPFDAAEVKAEGRRLLAKRRAAASREG